MQEVPVQSPTISLCMIVRDEAPLLPDCLKSVTGLVDEMIVVDTGSRDGTPDIARSLGARVYSFSWNDDFSAARNESLRHATGAWILALDGDEVLDPADHSSIRALIAKGDGDAYRLVQMTYEDSSRDPQWTPVGETRSFAMGCAGFIPTPIVRLFRNIPGVRFKGRVHELVEHDLLAQGRGILDAPIPIHHYGRILGRERLLRKYDLYRRIGEAKLLDLPSDPRAFCELGVQYLELGLHGEAAGLLKRALELEPRDQRALFNLAVAIEKGGNRAEAEEVYRKVLTVAPDHVGAVNNLALILQQHPSGVLEARRLYERAVSLNPRHHVLRFNYGRLLEKAGLPVEARDQYRDALKIHPAFEEARRQLERMTFPGSPGKVEEHPPAREAAAKHGVSVFRHLPARAEDFLRRERWIGALELLVPMLEEAPDDCEVRFGCARAIEGMGKRDEALEQYQEILARNPRHTETHYRLALECMRQGLFDDCTKLCRRLLEIQPDHPGAGLLLKKVSGRASMEKPPGREGRKGPGVRQCVPERLRIAFLWGGTPFLGDTLNNRPLGGTETAMIHMARSLAAMGHEVSVFIEQGTGVFDRVRYADIQGYLHELQSRSVDVLVAARIFHPFIVDVPAGAKVFWTEDAHDQPFVAFLSGPEVVDRIDRIFTVSRWQTRMLSEAFRIPLEKFFMTRNGILWDHFKGGSGSRNRKRLVYTSTPFRGLDVLLDVFPAVRERIPDAVLDVYSSMAVYQVDPETDQAQNGHLYRKARQPGVALKGSVTQKELAEALLSAGILAYPNHFAETSCIAALEALAAGLPVVTSALGALPETVATGGILIPGDARSPAYRERFVEEVCSLIEDERRWEALSAEGRARIYEHHRWESIAGEWTLEFERLLGNGRRSEQQRSEFQTG
ncbi:MAG: tetratricopeptide repeat protein [Thermodesulfobacteriota bacterium]